ncbi:MAG: aminopeptidase P family N-terminal domain-containing protein, partial [Pseudomonadota bacterium]
MSQTHPLVTTSSLQSPTERLNQFKRFLQKEGLDGFLVPKVDEHQGEYVPPHAERLRWLTGFSGSAGFAIVLQEKTALFVDGRYTLQAQDQVDTTVVEICPLANINPHTWLKDHIQAKQRIGFDPWLHTRENLERFQNEVTETETEWIPCSSNPIDELWTDQPARPQTKLKLHDVQFAGKTAQEKLKQITDSLVTQGVATCILTLPASVAWLFNIRASDIPFLPAPLGFAIVHVGGQAELFLNPPGQPQEVMQYFGENVSLYAREEFATRLRALVKNASHILVDKKTCPIFITDFLQGADCQVIFSQDPCLLPQACKNSVEITGARNAHIRDGTALVNFLAWLSRVVPAKNIT